MYDSRTNEFVTESTAPDNDLRAWRDDWRAMGKQNCTVGALARDEKSAQVEIAKELFEHGDYGYLADWVTSGKPVKLLDDYAPVFTPINDILNPLG